MSEGRRDMHLKTNRKTQKQLNDFVAKYCIDASLRPTLPKKNDTVLNAPTGMFAIYFAHFSFSNFRLPVSSFLLESIRHYFLHLSQMTPKGLLRVYHFEVSCRVRSIKPTVGLFRAFYRLNRVGNWLSFQKRSKPKPFMGQGIPSVSKQWKREFFYISNRAIPTVMCWTLHKDSIVDPFPKFSQFDSDEYERLHSYPTPLCTYPESLLVAAGISLIWTHPSKKPVFRNGEGTMSLLSYVKKPQGCTISVEDLAEDELPVNEITSNYVQFPEDVSTHEQDAEGAKTTDNDALAGGNATASAVVTNEKETIPSSSRKLRERKVVNLKRKNSMIDFEGSDESQKESSKSSGDDYAPGDDIRKKKLKNMVDGGESSGGTLCLDSEAIFKPSWGIRNGTLLNTKAACRDFLSHVRPASEVLACRAKRTVDLMEEGQLEAARGFLAYINLVDRMVKEGQETQLLINEMNSLESRCIELLEGRDGLAQSYGKAESKWVIERNKYEASIKEKDAEISDLRSRLKSVEDKNTSLIANSQWLMTDGFSIFAHKLRNSSEFLKALGEVQSEAIQAGTNLGLVNGFKFALSEEGRGKKGSDHAGFARGANARFEKLAEGIRTLELSIIKDVVEAASIGFMKVKEILTSE